MIGLFDWRILEGHQIGQPFLEQQLGRLDAPIGMEAVLHRCGVDGVVEREQAHPLVVSHVRQEREPPTWCLGSRSGV